MPNVLVAYATKHGSTREVAEAVSGALRAEGVQVDFRPARDVRGPIGDRDLVVLGAPIYSGRWHRDAHRFLKRHRKELLAVPVAVYGMGPRNPGEEAWQRSRDQLDRALAKRGWLRPTAVAVFGGVDPPKREGKRRRDLRDWEAVRIWATSIGHDLAQTPPTAGAGGGS
jgi:menaquinone-dependent protoporphyrinogen oxidase